MLIAINVLSILVFIGVAYLFSNDKKNVQWKSVGIVLVLELFLAWFFTQFKAGQIAVKAAADGFNWLVDVAHRKVLRLPYQTG